MSFRKIVTIFFGGIFGLKYTENLQLGKTLDVTMYWLPKISLKLLYNKDRRFIDRITFVFSTKFL